MAARLPELGIPPICSECCEFAGAEAGVGVGEDHHTPERGVMVSAEVVDFVDGTCVLQGDRLVGLSKRSREGTFASGPSAPVDAVCLQELPRGKSVSRVGGLKRLLITSEARAGMLLP